MNSRTARPAAAILFACALLAPHIVLARQVPTPAPAVYNVADYGIKGGSADETAQLLALLTKVSKAGGGVIQFNPGPYRFDGKLLLPNDGADIPSQPTLKFVGAGASHNGRGNPPNGGTVIDLRYNGPGGKIETRGVGQLEMTGIAFRDDGTGSSPFILSTLTTLLVSECSFYGNNFGPPTTQEAIVLGGTEAIVNGGAESGFQGYGTVIRGNHFNKVRRAVYGRVFANAVVVRDNTVWNGAGADATAAAIEFDGLGVSACSGGMIAGNLIEMANYIHAIKLDSAVQFTLVGNNFYDPGEKTKAYVLLGQNASFNTVIDGFHADIVPGVLDLSPGKLNTHITSHQGQESYFPQPLKFGGRVAFNSVEPVANLTAANHPRVVDVNGTQIPSTHMVSGSITLSNGEATVNFGAPFADAASYNCVGTDETAPNAVQVTRKAAGQILMRGTAGDTVSYQCVGRTSHPNPIDNSKTFVSQHYLDFLGRASDPEGQAFWQAGLDDCPTKECIEAKRVHTSAAFFLSIEFQQTGLLVYRLYQAAYGTGEHLAPGFFQADLKKVGDGVIVNATGWAEKLESNKRAFVEEFVGRATFAQQFPQGMTPAQFVAALDANAGGVLTQAEKDQLAASLASGSDTRAGVLRRVAENKVFTERQYNKAFVLMQYFGYLRRSPADPPDSDFTGYNFWLKKLEDHGGNFVDAEMVKAFLNSVEYRKRFGN